MGSSEAPAHRQFEDAELLVFDLRSGALLSSTPIPEQAAGHTLVQVVEAGAGVVVVETPAAEAAGDAFTTIMAPESPCC